MNIHHHCLKRTLNIRSVGLVTAEQIGHNSLCSRLGRLLKKGGEYKVNTMLILPLNSNNKCHFSMYLLFLPAYVTSFYKLFMVAVICQGD